MTYHLSLFAPHVISICVPVPFQTHLNPTQFSCSSLAVFLLLPLQSYCALQPSRFKPLENLFHQTYTFPPHWTVTFPHPHLQHTVSLAPYTSTFQTKSMTSSLTRNHFCLALIHSLHNFRRCLNISHSSQRRLPFSRPMRLCSSALHVSRSLPCWKRM